MTNPSQYCGGESIGQKSRINSCIYFNFYNLTKPLKSNRALEGRGYQHKILSDLLIKSRFIQQPEQMAQKGLVFYSQTTNFWTYYEKDYHRITEFFQCMDMVELLTSGGTKFLKI